MAEALQSSVAERGRTVVLGVGEQITRDARTRLVAAAGVVLVHSTYPPGSAVLASMEPGVQGAASALYLVTVTFPVHAFVLLSFLGLVRRMDSGAPVGTLLRGAFSRLVPAHLFWVTVFLAARAALEGRLPTGPEVLSGAFLGTAAAHLYFTPLLIALTALAPLWSWLGRTPLRALASALGLALLATTLGQQLPPEHWLTELIGVLAMAPMAIAGFSLGRAWGGVAPAQVRWPLLLVIAGVLIGALTLASAALTSGGQPLPLTWSLWASRLGLAVGVPVLLLAISGTMPMWLIRLAPLTLGVYFVHPLFIKALQWAELRVPALQGMEAALIVPNAALAILFSLGAVMLLARTPLRRCVL